MAQETLEETQRRLGLSTSPVTNQRTARQYYSPGKPPTTPAVNGRGAFRIAVAIAVLVAIGVVGYNVSQALPQLGLADDQWTDYPGTYFETDDYVLASDSLEATQASSEALMVELQDALADYGLHWQVESEGGIAHSSNGYDGESMLYDYQSDSLIGSVELNDPEARENIVRIFGEVLLAHDDSTVVIDNDQIDGDDAVLQFGSEDRDEQALWSAWSYSEHLSTVQGDITVFDKTVPTDDNFGNDYWVPTQTDDTLYVRLHLTAYYLLSEDDREAFITALEPYEGQDRPDYRG